MSFDEDLSSLVETLYEAALDDSQWNGAMAQILKLTDCQSASFCVIDSSGAPYLPVFQYLNFDPAMIDEYLRTMAETDPTIQMIAASPAQKLFHDSAYISEAEKNHHVYYDWHRQYSDTRHRIAGMARPAAHLQSGITVHRTAKKGDFDQASKALIVLLFRHIERALEIAFRLGTLGNLAEISLSVLDGNPVAIFVFDRKGRIIVANRAANALVEQRDGIVLENGHFVLQRQKDNQQFTKVLAASLNASQSIVSPPGESVAVLRPSGKRPFVITVARLPRTSFQLAEHHPAGCIMVIDPEKEHVAPPQLLQRLYGLTPAEARLALHLATGVELRQAAAALGIGYPTARTHLSRIFSKTRTRRQGELIRLLLASLPSFSC